MTVIRRAVFGLLLLVLTAGLAGAQSGRPVEPFEAGAWKQPLTDLDLVVETALSSTGFALPCSDIVFIRRVYLDMLGTMPDAEAVDAFVASTASDKRARLVDSLFDRTEFVEYGALFWADLLRVKAEFPVNLWPNAVHAYHQWLSAAVRSNMPYDRFARELIMGSGSNFRQPQANFYRAVDSRSPAGIARTVARTWLAMEPPAGQESVLDGIAAFFLNIGYKRTLEWKEEIVTVRPGRMPGLARFPDGGQLDLETLDDPRLAFADWLTARDNPWFAHVAANRLWYRLMGRGLLEPIDSAGNAPLAGRSAVLDHLAAWLREHGYDLRALMRYIITSRVYQQSSLHRDEPGRENLASLRYTMRRLDAEVLIDALDRIGGGGQSYWSPIPEPFTFIPPDHHSIDLADGSISSSFLMRFGRPTRDTGRLSERSRTVNAEQLRFLFNSTEVRKKLEQSPQLKPVLDFSDSRREEQIRRIYRVILSRNPTRDEAERSYRLLRSSTLASKQAALDLAWALLNSKEFLYQH